MAVAAVCGVKADDLYKASRQIDMRPPSVPLITSDTYLAIWSPYDRLTEGNTEHWAAAEHPLIGAVRVDGQTYRFMGKDKLALESIAPMTDSEPWEGRYLMNQKPDGNGTATDYDDSKWRKGKAAFGTQEMRRIGTEWKGENTDIWVRREFNMDNVDVAVPVYLKYSHDDVFEIYLNGEELVSTGETWKNDVQLELTPAMKAIGAFTRPEDGADFTNNAPPSAILTMRPCRNRWMYCPHRLIIPSHAVPLSLISCSPHRCSWTILI